MASSKVGVVAGFGRGWAADTAATTAVLPVMVADWRPHRVERWVDPQERASVIPADSLGHLVTGRRNTRRRRIRRIVVRKLKADGFLYAHMWHYGIMGS